MNQNTCRCLRCNRPLKDPLSIQRGYGRVCWNKVHAEDAAGEIDLTDRALALPLFPFIVLERWGDGVMTNVPHLVVHHSPTGFEWGYGGSGPADLALNILEAVLRHLGYEGQKTRDTWSRQPCYRLAYELHQEFKSEFIAPMDHAGGSIAVQEVIRWIDKHHPPHWKFSYVNP